MPDVVLDEHDWTARRQRAPGAGRRFSAGLSRGPAGEVPSRVGLSVHLLQPAARGSCGRGTPGSASCWPATPAERYLGRSGYGRVPAGVAVTRDYLATAWRHRAVHRRTAACDGVTARAAQLLRAARVGDGVPGAERAPRPRAAAARHCRHGRGRRVNAVALQSLRCVQVLHRAGHAPQQRAS